MQEIVLPDNIKPALEWVNNRVLQKVGPKRRHALAQARFVSALGAWADVNGLGMVGTEWHFQVQPPGEIGRTLVPDVAFLSYGRMPPEELEKTEIPRMAPDAVVEVRSPEDLQRDIDEKVRVYLAAGTTVIFLVDPIKKIVVVRDREQARTVTTGGLLARAALPGFSMPASALFTLAKPARKNPQPAFLRCRPKR